MLENLCSYPISIMIYACTLYLHHIKSSNWT